MRRWPILFLTAVAACPGPTGGGTVPEPDSCSDLVPRAPVDSVEIGAGTGSDVFVPWADGDPATIVIGPQGGSMIGMRMRLVGDSAPECVPHQSEVRDQDQVVIASLSEPVRAYDQGDGSMVTRTLWLIFDDAIGAMVQGGEDVIVEVEAFERLVTRHLVLEAQP